MNDTLLTDKVAELLERRDFQSLKLLLSEENTADIAEMLSFTETEKLLPIFRTLPKETAASVFVEMDTDQQQMLIESFSNAELRIIFNELYYDDTADIIEEMPANVVHRILSNCDKETRSSVNELLKYPADSAGGIMNIEFTSLKESMTVAQAFEHIRRTGKDKKTVYTCYVTSSNRTLIGVVSARDMMLADPDDLISDVMQTNVIFVNTLDDKETVVQMFTKYGFLAIPVVDKEQRLVGAVTVDDAIDVMSDEVEEDFAKSAAIIPTEKTYLKTSPFELWKARIPWLLFLMLSATFTGMIITSFESALAAQVVLTAFIPMLMGTAGNSGSQASVTVIRGLSLNELSFSDIFRVQGKELLTSLLCGVSLAVANFVKMLLVDILLLQTNGLTVSVALVVCVTIAITVVVAKFIGCTLPLVAKKLGFDPAVMASPLITTIVDAVSLFAYFLVATLFLKI